MVLNMESVAYIRVSTEEQVRGTSLSMQEKACLDFARAQGWNLSAIKVRSTSVSSGNSTVLPAIPMIT